MSSRPRHRSFPGLPRHRSGRSARGVALTSGSVLLALCATLLPLPGLTPFVQEAQAVSWSDSTVPEQRTGTAAGREHEVDAGVTDANGSNNTDPADLPAGQDALPLHDTGTGFTAVEPEIQTTEIRAQTSEGSNHVGYDPDLSTELAGERTATSKEFSNPDGTRTTRVYNEPVHYQDTAGEWRNVDTSLVPADSSGDRLTPAADDTNLTLAQRGDDPALAELSVEDGRHAVGFGIAGAAGATAEVSGDAATYQDVRRDSDVVLQAVHGAVKETIILNSPEAPREWVFPLTLEGLTPSLDVHGAVVLEDATGTVQAVIPKGWMEDSSLDPKTGGPALSGGVDYRLSQSGKRWSLTVVLDDAWLSAPERVYPVKVDPSVNDVDTNGDSFVQDSWPDSNFASDDELKIGSYDAGVNRAISYIRFDNVQTQLKNRYILNADLGLYNVWSSSCTAQEMLVKRVTGSWSASTVTWNNRPASSTDLVARDSFAHGVNCGGSKWRVIDLGKQGTDLVEGWVNGSVANNGLSLWASFTSSGPWKRFGSHNSANKPYLAVTHSAYGAQYTVGSQTEPLTGGQGGEVTVTVKNLGGFTWEPLGWNDVRLGARVRNFSTGALMNQVAFTRLNERVTPGDDTTLSARIPSLPPGQYKVNFDMQLLRDQRWFSSQDVPVATVTVTSQDIGPRITSVYPHPGGQVGSLTPALFMATESIDRYPAGAVIDSYFQVCEGTSAAPVNCVSSGWQTQRIWNVPAGKLAWGKQYVWRVMARENGLSTPLSPFYSFTTAVEQPAITSHLGGPGMNGGGREIDPGIGNYTTTDTDASVATVGPGLTVARTYNSRDPRSDNAFGAGWSTRYDMRIATDGDGTGNVVATLPTGRQIRFGKNTDGSYAPPYGSFSTLTAVTDGGWKLTDKDQTTYLFASSGRLTRVTDYRSREQTLTYDAITGRLATATSTGGRALHFTWTGDHIASVTTDAPETGATPLSWTYAYSGDRLTQVCGPEDAPGACTVYSYGDGSHYRTVTRDAGPYSYWRLNEATGADQAVSDLPLDRKDHDAGYHSVQLGTVGALQGSADTAATFNGSSAYMDLPDHMLTDSPFLTVEMWFRTTKPGVLATLQNTTAGTQPTQFSPFLNVDANGKLRGQFYTSEHYGTKPIVSGTTVTDGAWHHVALTGAGNTQTLYLDGTAVGSLTGTIVMREGQSAFVGSGWSSPGWMGVTAGTHYFTGDIDEVAVYTRPLGARTIAEHHAASATAQQLTKVTLPSGRVHSEVAYDTVHDRVSSYTDAGGGTYKLSDLALTGTADQPAGDNEPAATGTTTLTVTVTDPNQRKSNYTYDPLQGNRLIAQTDTAGGTAHFGYDTGGFLATTTGPDGTVTRLGHDARGNKISQTTCRDAGDSATCHTEYFEYFLNEAEPLDPRNDQLIAERDARSASATDNTYRTVHDYSTAGDRLSTTTPATTDFPEGRSVRHTFTDGTEAAVGGGTVPAGLPATTTDTKGGTTTCAYSAAGDLARVTDPAGVVTEYTYDALGRQTTATVKSDAHPEGITSTTVYDGESRPLTETGPQVTDHVTGETHRSRTTYTYDADGRPLSEAVSDEAGDDATRITRWAYDAQGRLVTLTDPAGGIESYTYDDHGRQTSRTLPGARTFRYTYTALGQLAEVSLTGFTGDPNNPAAPTDVVLDSYAYDPAGRLAEHTDAMGRTTRRTYYDDGLPAREVLVGFHDPDGTTRDLVLGERHYDAAGNLVKEISGNGAVTATYEIDAAGRVTAEVLDPTGLARRTAYTYDAAGAMASETRTGAGGTRTEKVTYQRDVTGAVTRRTVENGAEDLVTTWDVDDRGLVLSETSPRGNAVGADPAAHTTDHVYDVLGRLVETQAPPVTVETQQAGAATSRPTTRVGYNTFGETTAAKSPNGHTARTSYDALGRPVTTTLPAYTPPGSSTPLTATTSRTYDAAGNLATETDPLGGVTTYKYDQFGNLAKATGPAPSEGAAAPVSTFTYDLLGEQLSATGPTGARAEATYDDLGRQVTSTVFERRPAAGAFTTKLTYDDLGNLVSTTSPTGVTTATEFNKAGQPTSATDAAGKQTTYSYGPTGLTESVTTPQGRTTRTGYDPAGRATAVTDVDSTGTVLRSRTSAYDRAGNPVEVTDELGHTVRQSYDANGRLTKLVEPVDADTSITTTFGYDAEGNRTRLTDGRGNTTWTTFTSQGLPESIIEPATTIHPDAADRTFTTVYDIAGRPVQELKPDGVVQQRAFDSLGRITEVTGTGAEAPTTPDAYSYDLDGRVTSVNAPGGTNTYTYDDRGNLLSSSGPSGTATFRYDEEGRLAGRTDAAGAATFGYDGAGRLKTVADPLTGTTQTYGYDTASRLSSIAYGTAGVTRSLAYDVMDQLSTDTLKAPDGTTTASVGYSYDDAGRLTGKTTTGTAGAGEQGYEYDRAGRLTGWTAQDGTNTAYTWDASGNRTGAGDVTATYDERNRLLTAGDVSYTYSARGTRTGSSGPDGATTTAAFDAHGRMVSSDGTAYAYDGLGRLVKRGSSTLQYADQANDLVSGGDRLVFRGPGGDALSSASADGSGAAAILSDQHGDVTGAFAPSTGALSRSSSYSPFGEITAVAGGVGVLGYQGEFTDPATGQVNMHARWYDPANGGFTSRDSWTLNPVPSIQANRYGYGNAGPLLNTDPSGHSTCIFGVCTPSWLDDGIKEAERYANRGWRYVKKNPRKVIKFGAKRFLGPIGWASDAYDLARWLRDRNKEKPSESVVIEPWFGDPDPGLRPRPVQSPGRSWLGPTGPSRGGGGGGAGGGGGGGGGGTIVGIGTSGGCAWSCIPPGPPPPPPPPPWRELIAAALVQTSARPASQLATDSEHDQFVEDAYQRSLKDLELTAKQLRKYFKHFPGLKDDAMFQEEFKSHLAGWNDQPGNCMRGAGKSWVYYHPLDTQQRATGVAACLRADGVDFRGRGRKADANKQTDIMGSDTARGRGTANTNPAGWQHLDGDLGFARGHLLARQLGGNGRDRRNLVKMHNMANSVDMRDYEDAVRRRLDAGETIFYVSVPRYTGSNTMPDTIDLYAMGNRGYFQQWTVFNTASGLPPNGLTP